MPKTRYAMERCVEIISEGARRIPSAIQEGHTGIPWDDIKGIGNILRHGYDEIDVGSFGHACTPKRGRSSAGAGITRSSKWYRRNGSRWIMRDREKHSDDVVVVASAYLAAAGYLFLFQRNFVFKPSGDAGGAGRGRARRGQNRHPHGRRGTPLTGWYAGGARSADASLFPRQRRQRLRSGRPL